MTEAFQLSKLGNSTITKNVSCHQRHGICTAEMLKSTKVWPKQQSFGRVLCEKPVPLLINRMAQSVYFVYPLSDKASHLAIHAAFAPKVTGTGDLEETEQ